MDEKQPPPAAKEPPEGEKLSPLLGNRKLRRKLESKLRKMKKGKRPNV